MTSPWSTPRAGCWHAAASVTTQAGGQQLPQLLAEAGDTATEPIPVAIQRSRGGAGGLLARYRPARGRHQPPGRAPATGTGTVWRAPSPTTPTRSCWQASCAPTQAAQRPLPADSELAPGDRGAHRAQQDVVYKPPAAGHEAALVARGSSSPPPWRPSTQSTSASAAPQARAVLTRRADPDPGGQPDHHAAAPPAAGRRPPAQPQAPGAGGCRCGFHADQPRQLPLVEQAMR
jgi:hypothetical protein